MSFQDEMKQFFVEYVDAFARADAEAISELWDTVSLFPSATGNFLMERTAFREHCVTLLEFYRRQGVTRPEGELISATELFPNVAQTRMSYRMYGASNDVIVNWEHVYILRRSDRWRVSLTIADDEMAAWAAAGALG